MLHINERRLASSADSTQVTLSIGRGTNLSQQAATCPQDLTTQFAQITAMSKSQLDFSPGLSELFYMLHLAVRGVMLTPTSQQDKSIDKQCLNKRTRVGRLGAGKGER